MRILLISVDFVPHRDGVSVLAYHYARRLAERGHAVCVVAPGAPGDEAVDRDAGFAVRRFAGYEWGPLRFFPFAAAAWRAFGRHRPDVVLAMNVGYGGLLCRLLSCFRPGLRYVTMAYAYEFLKARRRSGLRRLYRAVYRRSVLTIAISEYTRRRLVEFGVEPGRVDVVHPGVAKAEGSTGAPGPSRAASGAHRIGTCGRLIRRKGHDLVIRAMPAILGSAPETEYVIAGAGPCRDALRALAGELGVAGRVRFLGEISPAELQGFYRSLDVFVMPSREDEQTGHVEGFGLVFLEAAAHGVPSVAARTGGVPEAVVDGETGLLVPSDSSEAIAAAVLGLLGDPGRRERLGARARARAVRDFSWDRQVDRVEELLTRRLGQVDRAAQAPESDAAAGATGGVPGPRDRLRVAVLTRTGRMSGARMAEAVVAGGHTLCGILAEKRLAMVWRALRRQSLPAFVRRHGAGFLTGRAWEAVAGALRRRTAGRGTAYPPADPVEAGRRLGAPFRRVTSLNGAAAVRTLREWNADVLVVANAPVLRPEVFRCCRLGALNFHSGRLPDYGGVASEFWTLYRGEAEAWVTVHRVEARLDAGEILAERAVPVLERDTPETLHERCVAAGAELMGEVIDRFSRGLTAGVRLPGAPVLRPWPTPRERRDLCRRRAAAGKI